VEVEEEMEQVVWGSVKAAMEERAASISLRGVVVVVGDVVALEDQPAVIEIELRWTSQYFR